MRNEPESADDGLAGGFDGRNAHDVRFGCRPRVGARARSALGGRHGHARAPPFSNRNGAMDLYGARTAPRPGKAPAVRRIPTPERGASIPSNGPGQAPRHEARDDDAIWIGRVPYCAECCPTPTITKLWFPPERKTQRVDGSGPPGTVGSLSVPGAAAGGGRARVDSQAIPRQPTSVCRGVDGAMARRSRSAMTQGGQRRPE